MRQAMASLDYCLYFVGLVLLGCAPPSPAARLAAPAQEPAMFQPAAMQKDSRLPSFCVCGDACHRCQPRCRGPAQEPAIRQRH